jgi:polyisoprenoid-binding protein YceI
MKKWIVWAIVGVVAAVALLYGAIFVYANWINDPEDELTTEDLDEALQTTLAPVDTATSDTAPADTATATTEAPASGGASDPSGTWSATTESEAGYRVPEILMGVDTEGVGRTNEVSGTMTVDGTSVTAVDITVDMASVTSDKSRRDEAFRGRIMEVDTYPTATFVLTEPIDLGSIPAEGEQATATATGELTLHGVTNTVTFEVTAQYENGRIGVLGSIPVVFSDYGIDNPSSGPVEVGDEGTLEFVLVFEPA